MGSHIWGRTQLMAAAWENVSRVGGTFGGLKDVEETPDTKSERK